MISREAVAWGDGFASVEHVSTHVLDTWMILTCLAGTFFGAQWRGTGLQGFERGVLLKEGVQV